ncbi:hypothetical protein JKF63_03009 [Porcisia hertigi]|uniref:P-type phospholipid transporter n=1 Tax=Porcisia hertigi TaxID=2761500 RepID=A0A836HTB2_9TRYP|nr:hypothetical protein JKF63_03009 [Porcisia hertigi]
MASPITAYGASASPPSPGFSRTSPSSPHPVQRRFGNWQASRALDSNEPRGDAGGCEIAVYCAAEERDSVVGDKAPGPSASVATAASLWGRRLGLRLLLFFKNAAQCLAVARGTTNSAHCSRGRAAYSPIRRGPHPGTAHHQEMRYIRPLDPAVADRYCTNRATTSRYTVQNFIFKNLYEQFRRPLNFYFLLVTLLQFISVIAPVNPLSTLLPLLFAFTLSAVKEGHDDVKRHRQDHTYNHTPRMALDPETTAWRSRINADIRVGDVLLLREGEEIPCDVVVLGATSSSVYIRTDNLDGEIDLKPREMVQWSTVHPDNHSLRTHTVCEVTSETEPPPASSVIAAVKSLHLECAPPSAMIDSFDGRADIQTTSPVLRFDLDTASTQVSLTHLHLLPQSCILKNVAQVVCVAVYTGDDTKFGMNRRATSVKWARIDKDVSRFSVCIFVCQIVSALILGLIGYRANRKVHETVWYLPLPVNESSVSVIIYPLRFFLLTTVMIPVSFKFVVDVCKDYMARMVEWDSVMMQNEAATVGSGWPSSSNRTGCRVKNSSILEDLGQIDYLLCDKTGTLTQNMMELHAITICPGHHLSLAGMTGPSMALPEALTATDSSAFVLIRQFAQMVALCNTVEVVHPSLSAVDSDGNAAIHYHAASPDEVALCMGMRRLGVSLVSRDQCCAVLRTHRGPEGKLTSGALPVGPCYRGNNDAPSAWTEEQCDVEERWTVHYTFQFSSEKKSMGIIVEEPTSGRIWFIVKGADDRVMEMASSRPSCSATPGSPRSSPLNSECAAKLSVYSHRGLRTLLVARKELSRDDLAAFLQSVAKASRLTENRQAYLDSLRSQMESGVTIVGITAVEDKLQDGVQETISDMHLAGIKVWMLTGDKVETAEQIGLSCGLYRPGDVVIRIGQPLPSADPREGSRGCYDETANASDWRQMLLTFPIERLLPSYSASSQLSSAIPVFSSESSAYACGKALESRVLRFDASDSSQLSNESLHTIAQTAESRAERAENSIAGGLSESGGATPSVVLVVQGGTVLETILHDPALWMRFSEISSRCCSVICARTTPHQKAAVTRFVRQAGFMTLSIGDGGNDVAMLQEAHIGVGIMGKEGQQAARAADFSITQFSDLRALLFVHGQQAYARSAYVIKYSFYKSMLISFIQLAYNLVGTNVSGGAFWNSFSLTLWNGFYTLPQTILYCFDRCAPRVVLERNPYLYKMTRRALDIRPREFFCSYLLRGMLQSVGLLWLCTRLYGPGFAYADTGGTASNDVTFTIAYSALMVSQVFSVWWESHTVTPLNLLVLLGMPLLYVYSTSVYSDYPALEYFGVFRRSLDMAGYFSVFGVSLALVVPSLIYSTTLVAQHPNPRDVLRCAETRRQRAMLARSEYRCSQPFWVRWFGATPEAASVLCSGSDAALHAHLGDEGVTIC